MFRSLLSLVQLTTLLIASSASAQQQGYFGYERRQVGNESDTTYATADTPANVSLTIPDPDVYVHAKVHVGEIDVLVANLSAKINLDAQVLSLLQFNAGVDVSINRVFLTIQNVSAEVYLEARLENVVTMIGDVLDSLDLNPVLATLGQSLDNITETVGGALGGVVGGLVSNDSSSTTTTSNGTLATRGLQEPFNLIHNILFSVNNFEGQKHKNRVLAQNGDIVDEQLDANGNVVSKTVVGNFKTDMQFTGHNHTTVRSGQNVFELEYTYTPLPGVLTWSAIYEDAAGKVVGTQVLAEGFGGGGSTVD